MCKCVFVSPSMGKAIPWHITILGMFCIYGDFSQSHPLTLKPVCVRVFKQIPQQDTGAWYNNTLTLSPYRPCITFFCFLYIYGVFFSLLPWEYIILSNKGGNWKWARFKFQVRYVCDWIRHRNREERKTVVFFCWKRYQVGGKLDKRWREGARCV